MNKENLAIVIPASIDYQSLLQSSGNKKDCQEKVIESLKNVGFFKIKNLPISQELKLKAIESHQDFFNLDSSIKEKYICKLGGGRRGYIPKFVERPGLEYAPEEKEMWHVSREPHISDPRDTFYVENFWPSEVQDFKKHSLTLYSLLDDISFKMMAVLGGWMGCATYAHQIMNNHNSVLRIIKYHARNFKEGEILTPGHHDVTLFSLHLYQSHQGIEFKINNKWRSYEVQNDEILLSSGDMLDYISNGVFPSSFHRIVKKGHYDYRYYLGYFVHPHPEAMLFTKYNNGDQIVNDKGINNLDLIRQRMREMNLSK